MRRGRPEKELIFAMKWLEEYLGKGPRLSTDIKKGSAVSYRTLLRAKARLGIKSKKIGIQWYWYNHDFEYTIQQMADGKKVRSIKVKKYDNPGDEPEQDDTVMTLEGMIECGQHLIETSTTLADIERELIKSCTEWPDPVKPFPHNYIRSVAKHVFSGTPIDESLR